MRNLGYGKNLMNFFLNSVANAGAAACREGLQYGWKHVYWEKNFLINKGAP